VGSSSGARELFTRFDTGHRCNRSSAAGLSNSRPAPPLSHGSKSWAVMFFGPLAHLTHLAGGTPFDIRPRGYSYGDARTFLEAIGKQGRAYYANPELVIDTFYPPLYAVSRGLALWWLTMPGRVREAPLPLKVRYALVAVPILMASLDLVENGCIAVMLWTWPDLSHGLVEISSLATQVKIMAGVLTEVLMAVAAIWLMRWCIRHRWTEDGFGE
jgi:hypothetical protein